MQAIIVYGSWPTSNFMSKGKDNFWEFKSFKEMTADEWESLCDGCGRCCLFKLEEDETSRVFYTGVACRHLDLETCLCVCYENRRRVLPECIVLTPDRVDEFQWLPATCAYRRICEGKGLAAWHPLVSGNRETVHQSNVSVRDKAISEKYVDTEHLEAYVLDFEI